MNQKTCIVIGGPTAVGKTSLAIRLAAHYRTQILSADSRQCFRELNIGVAKPSPAELDQVRHYFISSHSVTETVTAADFEQYGLQALAEIFQQSDVAVVVGGTGLYLKALLEGLDQIPQVPQEIREEVIKAYELYGIAWLQERLKQEDPLFYQTGEMQNPQRMMRALEVVRYTGQSIRSFQKKQRTGRAFQTVPIRLSLEKEKLFARIDQRVDQMVKAGLLDEVKSLVDFRQLNALQTVGYQEIFDHLDGKLSVMEEAAERIKSNTRKYAKRQETWFQKYLSNSSYAPEEEEKIIAMIDSALT
jgi:tRNA dimethylallyltransferase